MSTVNTRNATTSTRAAAAAVATKNANEAKPRVMDFLRSDNCAVVSQHAVTSFATEAGR